MGLKTRPGNSHAPARRLANLRRPALVSEFERPSECSHCHPLIDHAGNFSHPLVDLFHEGRPPGKKVVSPILSDSRGFTPQEPDISAGTELAMDR
jgi:hypothetical protein